MKRDSAISALKRVFNDAERRLDIEIENMAHRAEARVRLEAVRREVMATIGTTDLMRARGETYRETRIRVGRPDNSAPLALQA